MLLCVALQSWSSMPVIAGRYKELNKMTNVTRQGDVLLVSIEKMPEGLEASKENVLLANGSGGHSHSFKGGKFYPKVDGDFVIGYLVAKGTTIHHPEHSPKGDAIEDGVYEVRRQNEFTPAGMKQVID